MANRRPQKGPEAAAWIQRELADRPPRRIFVPGREHIGDAVNLTGPLVALRSLFPEAHIVVEVGERAASVIQAIPGINEVWPRPTHQGISGKAAHIQRLRREAFDLAVLLDDSNNLVLQARLGGIPRRVGIWRGKKYEDLFDAYVPLDPNRHEVRDVAEDVLHLLGWSGPCAAPHLFVTAEQEAQAEAAWRATVPNQRPLVGLHTTSSDPNRSWSHRKMAELAQMLQGKGLGVVLVGGPGEQVILDEIESLAGPLPRLREPLPLQAFAYFLAKLDLLVCMDSGPMHLCAAMGGNVCALYAVFDPAHTGPWGSGHAIIRAASRQIDDIEPEEVLAVVLRHLGIDSE